jgi:hypothetical protein
MSAMIPRLALAASLWTLLLSSLAASAIAQEASILVENRSDVVVVYRAASGFQGSVRQPLPQEIGPGETGLGEVRAGFPATQGGGFRYSRGGGECDFGFLRMRDGSRGPWGYPQTRANATGRGLSCRAEVLDASSGGDFSIRFIVE